LVARPFETPVLSRRSFREGGFLVRSWFVFTKAGHQKKFGYRSRVPSIASSEKNRANRQKRVSKAIVHQPAAQFYERFVEGIKQRIRPAQIKGCDFGQPRIDLALLGHWPRHCRRAAG